MITQHIHEPGNIQNTLLEARLSVFADMMIIRYESRTVDVMHTPR